MSAGHYVTSEKEAERSGTQQCRGMYLVKSKDRDNPSYIHCNSLGDFLPPSEEDVERMLKSTNDRPVLEEESKRYTKFLLLPCPIANDMNLTNGTSNAIQTPKSPKEIKKTLNLHLGLPDLKKSKIFVALFKILNILFKFIENRFFKGWDSVPLRLRQKITMLSWSVYLPLHKFLLSNKTAIHKNASYEYHALTTILYWGRFFPVTFKRMRFALNHINAFHHPQAIPFTLPRKKLVNMDVYNQICKKQENRDNTSLLNLKGSYIRTKSIIEGVTALCFDVYHDMNGNIELSDRPIENKEHGIVNGYYLQHGEVPSKKVIMYLYGGAFLGGEPEGNLNFAEKFGQHCQYTDVFLPQYRLIPEYTFSDALHDVLVAYEYLVKVRDVDPVNIILFGVSSGGGLHARLMQRLAEMYWDMPCGAVLIGPFVDYTDPKGHFLEYQTHDLIVSESVCEFVFVELNNAGDNEARWKLSALSSSFEGLPPLCVVFSLHESITDQVQTFCNKARSAGIQVDIGLWRYVCHVWPLFTFLLPEAQQAFEFMSDWVKNNCI